MASGSESRPAPPAAAAAATDGESSNTGTPDTKQALFALDVMRDRRLIDDATYAARRAALLAESGQRHGSAQDPAP
jgi:hypothetical protein